MLSLGPLSGDRDTPPQFQEVLALGRDEVWVAGSVSKSMGVTRYFTLAARWDGTSWEVTDTVDPDGRDNYLRAIDGTPGDLWTVGTHDGDRSLSHDTAADTGSGSDTFTDTGSRTGSPRTLTEHWDGAGWVEVPSPRPGDVSELHDVAVVDSDDVWAVGRAGTFTTAATLTIHWDGADWTTVDSPTMEESTFLFGVDGIAADDAWAVGYSRGGADADTTVLLHWDGTAWVTA